METAELLKKVRKIEIKTKGLSNQIFAGEYHSAFKGRGMAFSEVREYMFGDDVRNMDWNVTARLNTPYVKVFEEERELTVMLLLDLSSSRIFGTKTRTKRELMTEIAAVISFSASANNDKVGAIFFSDKIEKFIPPKKGRSHLLRIIRELLEFEPTSKKTDISQALRYLTNALKNRSTAFLISDLIDTNSDGYPLYEESIKIASNRHDLSVIRVFDSRELELPNLGLVRFNDVETGAQQWIDTGSKDVRESFNNYTTYITKKSKDLFKRLGIDNVSISTSDDYVKELIKMFNSR